MHWVGAAVFAWGGISHCNAVNELMAMALQVDENGVDLVAKPPLTLPPMRPILDAHRDLFLSSLALKKYILKAPMAMFLLPLLFQM